MFRAAATGRSALNRALSLDFAQPIGPHVDLDLPYGYYLDLSVKAPQPVVPSRDALMTAKLYIQLTQFGLGSLERLITTGDERWLVAALAIGDHLVSTQRLKPGPQFGGWVHDRPLEHTFALQPPWLSGMAQGQGASLLVRLFLRSGDERYAVAASRAIRPLAIPTEKGGVRARVGMRSLPEEYPTSPPSWVLNGAIFALWGMADVARGLGDSSAASAFALDVDTVATELHRWDTGGWSRYDLFPHRVPNLASVAYHRLHIDQLRMLHRLAPRPELAAGAERFEHYGRSKQLVARAQAAKLVFRVLVPRSRRAG